MLRLEAIVRASDEQEDLEEQSYAFERTLVLDVGVDRSGVATERLAPAAYACYSKAKPLLKDYVEQPESTSMDVLWTGLEREQAWPYLLAYIRTGITHRFFLTEQDGQTHRMGMGPMEILPNDRVVIFAGGRMPFILRRGMKRCTNDEGLENGCYTLIGAAYVHGIMDGVVGDEKIGEESSWEDIYLC